MKDENSVPTAQKMTDVSLSIFRSKFKKTRIQMIDYTNRLASLDRPIGGVQAALLWITTAADIWICLYPTTLNSIWKRLRNPVRRRTASIHLLRCFLWAPG